MQRNRPTKILQILKKDLNIPKWNQPTRNPFQTLIITVLSQNTAEPNTTKAFNNLSKKFSITAEVLSEANIKEIEECIRVGGLYRNKSKTIKELSSIILGQFKGSLDFIYTMPFEKARKILMDLPGVGPKTADVVLLFSAKKFTIPIDTHVNRVSKKLGLANPNAGYEEVRRVLQLLFSPRDYLAVHLLLISLGRKYCKARRPVCKFCPVTTLCPKIIVS